MGHGVPRSVGQRGRGAGSLFIASPSPPSHRTPGQCGRDVRPCSRVVRTRCTRDAAV
ncbi:hypothetical protein STXM2123_908 [Streptomyces sp. F-3]|nr:hypothetical protein STXM2123_908 [Streptomyces sp. F-3]